jgi:hypothetical protein
MCNQTEMYKAMSDYDSRASRGEVHIRGVAHNPKSCPKCALDALEKRVKTQERIAKAKMRNSS